MWHNDDDDDETRQHDEKHQQREDVNKMALISFTVGEINRFACITSQCKAQAEGERLLRVIHSRMQQVQRNGVGENDTVGDINLVIDTTKVQWSSSGIRSFYKNYVLPSSAQVTLGTLKITNENLHRILFGNVASFCLQCHSDTLLFTFARDNLDREETSANANEDSDNSSGATNSDLSLDYQESQQI